MNIVEQTWPKRGNKRKFEMKLVDKDSGRCVTGEGSNINRLREMLKQQLKNCVNRELFNA